MRRFPLFLSLVGLCGGLPLHADPPTAPDLYHEALRPQIHFSAKEGWLNDPNGLVYFGGQYHLFFQHTPGSRESGVKSWGHAVSPDLVHWTQVAEALTPGRDDSMWSGSAVVDRENRSGFGQEGKPPLVLIYTRAPLGDEGHGQTSLAYSLDGLHFTKFTGNPVLPDLKLVNRDPRVFWYAPGKHWVLALYVEEHDHHNIRFYVSGDLRHWTQISQFEGGQKGYDGRPGDNFLYECPDIWEMPVEREPGQTRWVLTAGNTEYMVGRFDGEKFTPETPKLPGQSGQGYYAPQTFNDEPQGRRVRIGWLQTAAPGMPFSQSMSLPSEHKLVRTPEGLRLTWVPVEELKSLRDRVLREGPKILSADDPPFFVSPSKRLEIRARFRPGKTGRTVFLVHEKVIAYDAADGKLRVGNQQIPVSLADGKLDLTIYVDALSLEVYANGGLTYVPVPINFGPEPLVSVSATGEPVEFDQLDAYELASAWPDQPGK